MADQTDIAQIIGILSAAFPNFNPTELTAEVYYQVLSDIPSEELKMATRHCIAEAGRKFAPSVGELRGAVGELRGYVANVPSSYQAWQEVLQQINDVGSYGTPKWSNPIVEKAVRAMGWRNLCLSEEQTADRARFIQCYEQFEERAGREEMMQPAVRGYLEVNGARVLAPADQIKRLSERLGVK